MIELFIAEKLASFIGDDINRVGRDIETLVLGRGYWFRWLGPREAVAPEHVPFRVNVHVTKRHRITRITAG